MSEAIIYHLRDCTPNAKQRQLLHAALDSGDSALRAWREWRAGIDLDNIDPASFRLLPMAYRNMVALNQDDPLVQRLKGVYRHSWYRNQIQFRQAQDVLANFEQAGLPVMLLKGAALSQRFYKDAGIRFMNDVDFMVAETDYEQAAHIMLAQGWQPALYSCDAMFWYHRHRFKHGCGFKLGNIELDLHSRLLRFVPHNEQALWAASIRGSWQGHTVQFLSDTDQLYHSCAHGLRWSYAYLSWIPDALAILRDDQTEIDWASLIDTTRHTRTIPYLRNALAFLREEFQAPVPRQVLSALDALPQSWVERGEYQLLGEQQSKRIAYQTRRLLYQSCRYRQAQRKTPAPIKLSLTAWLKFLYLHVHPAGLWQAMRQKFQCAISRLRA